MTEDVLGVLLIIVGAPALVVGFFFGVWFSRADRHIKNEDWWI